MYAAKANLAIARRYYTIGKDTAAFHYLFLAFSKIELSGGDSQMVYNTCKVLGYLSYRNKDYKKSIEYCQIADSFGFYTNALGSWASYHDPGDAYDIACNYAMINEKEKALIYLEKSFKHGFQNFDHIKLDSDLDPIRSTPEFKALMKKYFPTQYKE